MIVVAGAGPTGLATAFALGDVEHLIVDPDEPGGVCRSFELGGATFDFGGHAFFTSDTEVMELLAGQVPVHTQPRQAWVWHEGTYVPYPFQSHLHGLPVDTVRDCLVGLFEVEPTTAPATSLDDWLLRSFGPGLVQHFLGPYNRKIWAWPLDEVVPTWATQRIVMPDIGEIVDGALRRRPFTSFPNAHVRYPETGGFMGLFQPLVEATRSSFEHDRVVAVDLGAKVATLEHRGPTPFDVLVSTMPLPELVARTVDLPEALRARADDLAHNSLHLVNLAVRGLDTEMQRVYVADPACPFHKLVLNHNSSPSLRSRPVASVQAEVSYSVQDPGGTDGLVDRVTDVLHEMGLLGAGTTIEASSIVDLRYAYPIPTPRGLEALAELLAHFDAHGVVSIGRFGEWAYINSDRAVRRGLDVGRALRAGERDGWRGG